MADISTDAEWLRHVAGSARVAWAGKSAGLVAEPNSLPAHPSTEPITGRTNAEWCTNAESP